MTKKEVEKYVRDNTLRGKFTHPSLEGLSKEAVEVLQSDSKAVTDYLKENGQEIIKRAEKDYKDLRKRAVLFHTTIIAVKLKHNYTSEMSEAFFKYWTEPNGSFNRKMRFELEKTWDIDRRMARWHRTNQTNNPDQSSFQSDVKGIPNTNNKNQ